MFNHVDLKLPNLERETIDGVRYYKIPDNGEILKLFSITSVTSHKNRQFFADWRKRIGESEADKITLDNKEFDKILNDNTLPNSIHILNSDEIQLLAENYKRCSIKY